MTTAVTCTCGKKLLLKPEVLGKRIRCPNCQQIKVFGKEAAVTSETVRLRCKCGTLVSVATKNAGKNAKCPACNSLFEIPQHRDSSSNGAAPTRATPQTQVRKQAGDDIWEDVFGNSDLPKLPQPSPNIARLYTQMPGNKPSALPTNEYIARAPFEQMERNAWEDKKASKKIKSQKIGPILTVLVGIPLLIGGLYFRMVAADRLATLDYAVKEEDVARINKLLEEVRERGEFLDSLGIGRDPAAPTFVALLGLSLVIGGVWTFLKRK